jgi:hypothetical protein
LSDATTHWRDVLATLESQRKAELKREEKIALQRQKLALKALVGDSRSQRLLRSFVSETVTVRARLEDLGSAITEAQQQLAEAERVEGQAQEAARQRALCELAERQLVQATIVEGAIRALTETIAAMEEISAAMAGIYPTNDAHFRRVDPLPVLALALQAGVGRHLGMPQRSRDPRFGRGLQDLIAERLRQWLPEAEQKDAA